MFHIDNHPFAQSKKNSLKILRGVASNVGLMQREASILIKLYGRISDLDAAFKVGIAETDGDFELLFRMFV